jgi:hypothetical protein
MQLKHVPLCFLIMASICLAGAVNASARPKAETGTVESAQHFDPPTGRLTAW